MPPVNMAEYMLNRYYRRRSDAIEKLGGKCAICGSTEKLDFHHIDPLTKEFSVGRALSSMADARLQEEISKCELRCKDCHHQAHAAKERHGTPYTSRRCKCGICMEAQRAYHQMYRARKRAEGIIPS